MWGFYRNDRTAQTIEVILLTRLSINGPFGSGTGHVARSSWAYGITLRLRSSRGPSWRGRLHRGSGRPAQARAREPDHARHLPVRSSRDPGDCVRRLARSATPPALDRSRGHRDRSRRRRSARGVPHAHHPRRRERLTRVSPPVQRPCGPRYGFQHLVNYRVPVLITQPS